MTNNPYSQDVRMPTSDTPAAAISPPREGMLATIRNRRGVITAVEPFGSQTEEHLHLVSIEYTDSDGADEDRVIWEREVGARVWEPTLQSIQPSQTPSMRGDQFDALVRSTRWSAMSPFLDPDGSGPLERNPIAAPLYGAIQVEDYQLVPLAKALEMPRISLLLADDVGLGKTVEAGLIVSELVLRRRARRILIIAPASLRGQWRQEMRDKFSLSFEEVDRPRTQKLRRELGIDANPWRIHPRIVASYDYLKQPDVFEEFRSACQVPDGSPHLPWDLLIVDEAHNLAPAPFGAESDVSRMLGRIAPYFEHRIFLTATPHNGFTRSFTGLLEHLDPSRFTRTATINQAQKSRIDGAVIRRLKREINAFGPGQRFSERRPPQAILLRLHADERGLQHAFQTFRSALHSAVARRDSGRGIGFAIEVLGKRLLSCPVAFADTWHRYRLGMESSTEADAGEVDAVRRAMAGETTSDLEAEALLVQAAEVVGAWLRPYAADVAGEMAAIDDRLDRLGLGDRTSPPQARRPHHDARLTALLGWIDTHLRQTVGWRDDERLVVFTEYKTTLDYLADRLAASPIYGTPGAIRVLYGGLAEHERTEVKAAFNNSADPCRILIATDAASEGLNLQETARFVLHWDIPWNPARLEQRNGRLDRHGQARDVVVHHFDAADDRDLAFLSRIVAKIEQMREDLGAVGELFERAFHRRLVLGDDGDDLLAQLDRGLAPPIAQHEVPTATDLARGRIELERLHALEAEVDLDPGTLASTFCIAIGLGQATSPVAPPDTDGRHRLQPPVPAAWMDLVDQVVRTPDRTTGHGALRAIAFDPACFHRQIGQRTVFRPRPDTVLAHLAHPLIRRSLSTFARLRFPGTAQAAPRWTVRRGPLPAGLAGIILLTVEELAVNDLRETLHHWVRTVALPIGTDGELGSPLPHRPSRAWTCPDGQVPSDADVDQARALHETLRPAIARALRAQADDLNHRLRATLNDVRAQSLRDEDQRFQSRQGELAALMREASAEALQREIDELRSELQEQMIFGQTERDAYIQRLVIEKQAELVRRTEHLQDLMDLMGRERERTIRHLIPRRFTLRGEALALPVAIEYRLAEGQP